MTEIPIIVSTNEVTVAGMVSKIVIETEVGTPGKRGSRIFSGDTSPVGLQPDHVYFGGIAEFVVGDMFLVRSGENIGDVWEYRSLPGGDDWVRIIQRITQPEVITGANSPEGVVAAPQGSMYTRTNGSANTTLYIKTAGGSSNTGWTAK